MRDAFHNDSKVDSVSCLRECGFAFDDLKLVKSVLCSCACEVVFRAPLLSSWAPLYRVRAHGVLPLKLLQPIGCVLSVRAHAEMFQKLH